MRGRNISFRGWNARTPIVTRADDPRAVGVCDGCSFWVPNHLLRKHMVYRGGITTTWDGMLFCSKCDDVPNPAPQFSRLKLYPDPVPVEFPRPQVPDPQDGGYAYWVDDNGALVNTQSDGDTWGGEFVQTISNWEMTQ